MRKWKKGVQTGGQIQHTHITYCDNDDDDETHALCICDNSHSSEYVVVVVGYANDDLAWIFWTWDEMKGEKLCELYFGHALLLKQWPQKADEVGSFENGREPNSRYTFRIVIIMCTVEPWEWGENARGSKKERGAKKFSSFTSIHWWTNERMNEKY